MVRLGFYDRTLQPGRPGNDRNMFLQLWRQEGRSKCGRAVSGENLRLLHRRPFPWESSEGGREISRVSFRRSLIPSTRVPPKTNTLGIRFQHLNTGCTVSLQQQETATSRKQERTWNQSQCQRGSTAPCPVASGGGLVLGASHSLPVKRGHPPHSVTAARTLPAHWEDNTLLRDKTAARTECANAGSTPHRSCHTRASSPQRLSSP